MMAGWRVGAAVAIVSCVVAAGCATSDDDAANAAPRGACPTAPVSVVVSVDQWGDIVDALAGDCGDVTTIFKSTSADPHDYEPTPADVARFSGADLVVVNGLDYDPWAAKAVATLDRRPAIVNGGDVVGLDAGDNPHIWYGPEYVDKVAAAVSAKLRDLAPEDASYFDQRHDAWRTSMHAYDELIAKIKPAAEGKTYGATEGIFDDMAVALGLTNETPAGYQKATANETDPAPGDIHEFEQALSGGRISVLVFNTQTEGSVPDQIRRQARAAKVPVVDVTESVPPKFKTFVDWQVHQLRDLEAALT